MYSLPIADPERVRDVSMRGDRVVIGAEGARSRLAEIRGCRTVEIDPERDSVASTSGQM